MMVLCKNCRFLLNKEPNSPRRDVWYNHLCLASPVVRLDFYDGPKKEFKFCRDVNTDGHCPKFSSIS
jgi:hypothetical protein